MIEPAVYRELGLKDDEYRKIEQLLGREPTPTELAMFSVEWSEHCGYPRSRPLLRLLPREGKFAPRVAGDAGGVEVVPGVTVLFKLESHNHPSQVEPKQGAATGVGGSPASPAGARSPESEKNARSSCSYSVAAW